MCHVRTYTNDVSINLRNMYPVSIYVNDINIKICNMNPFSIYIIK